MHDFKKPIDFFLVDKVVDPFAQKIQKLTGLDCFVWAKLFYNVTIAIRLVSIIFQALLVGAMMFGKVPITLMITMVICLLMMCGHLLSLISGRIMVSIVQNKMRENPEGYGRNPMIFANRCISLRLLQGFMLVYDVVIPIMSGQIDANTISYAVVVTAFSLPFLISYIAQLFMACTPLPKKKSKIRELMESFQKWREESSSPGGAMPVPA